jgi:periplasmic protein TonB
MMKPLFAVSLVVLSLCLATSAVAQDALNPARQLYASADYEGALTALDRVSASTGNEGEVAKEVGKYRVLCLVALGRTSEADAMIEQMLKADPLYEPSLADAPPRIRTAFTRVRDRILPSIARASYDEGKAAFDNKTFDVAVLKLEETMRILDQVGPGGKGDLADLRTLTKGFLDLSRASLVSPPAGKSIADTPKPAVADAPATAAAPSSTAPGRSAAGPTPRSTPASGRSATAAPPAASGASARDAASAPTVTDRDPVAVQQAAPPFSYDLLPARSRVEYRGVVEVEIDERGQVVAAQITRPVHPLYDSALLKAAQGWTYLPAYRDGKPVRSRKRVEIVLRPR